MARESRTARRTDRRSGRSLIRVLFGAHGRGHHASSPRRRATIISLKIENIDDDTAERLRVRAALNGRSVEDEVRVILRSAVSGASGADLWSRSRALFADADGVDLELATRGLISRAVFSTRAYDGA